jgi:hypothetical protein
MTDHATLFTALVAFQKAMTNVHKGETARVPTKSGGSFEYKYADIAKVIDAVRDPLAANGLCYLQIVTHLDGQPALQTVLAHESGEHIEGTVPIRFDNITDPQKFGGALTYLRRYALLGILGLATDDDDAQHASQSPASARPAAQSMPPNKAPQLHTVNTGGASHRPDEDMDWTELYSLTRPLGYKDRPAIEALIGQSVEGMSPKQVYDAFKGAYKADGGTGELAQSTAPAPRQVQNPASVKQIDWIKKLLMQKGIDARGWTGWAMYNLDTDDPPTVDELDKTQASRVIELLKETPDNKDMAAAIESSGGISAYGR